MGIIDDRPTVITGSEQTELQAIEQSQRPYGQMPEDVLSSTGIREDNTHCPKQEQPEYDGSQLDAA